MKDSDIARILVRHDYWDPQTYHKSADDAYRQFGAGEALLIIEAGLTRFPFDVDLLVDALSWAPITNSEAEANSDQNDSESYRCRLEELKSNWSRKTYEAMIDYQVKYASTCPPLKREERLRLAERFAQDYIRAYPSEELPYLYQAKVVYVLTNSYSLYLSLLQKIVMREYEALSDTPVVKSCLAFAENSLKDGKYDAALQAATTGLSDCVSTESADDTENLLILMALARDGKILQARRAGSGCIDDLNLQINMYDELVKAIKPESPLAHKVRLRLAVYRIYLLNATDSLRQTEIEPRAEARL